MEAKYEAIVYKTGPSIFEVFLFSSPPPGLMVRQLGEQPLIPVQRLEVLAQSPWLSRAGVDRWIRDYDRGFTNYETYVKSQVSKKEWRKLQKLGVDLDTRILAKFWADFVDFKKRRETEVPFLQEQLVEYSNPRIFDACLGSGTTTLGLKLAGLKNVTSNEIDQDLIEVAQEEAQHYGANLTVTSHDWRELNQKYRAEFDAVLCLGNSLTYLFKKEDQLQTLHNFRDILKPNGSLIIDERNYAGQVLPGKFRCSGEVVYCGIQNVDVHPIYISEAMVVMEYKQKPIGPEAHLVLYPFKRGELKALLEEAGFTDIKTFGDYKPEFNPAEPEFITHVAKK